MWAMTQQYSINLTINTPEDEFDGYIPSEVSLDAAMAHCLQRYPDLTSVVMVVLPLAPQGFSSTKGDDNA
jgi:hypothetical protein